MSAFGYDDVESDLLERARTRWPRSSFDFVVLHDGKGYLPNYAMTPSSASRRWTPILREVRC